MKKQPFTEKDFYIAPEKQPDESWTLIDKWLKTKDAEKFFAELNEIKH